MVTLHAYFSKLVLILCLTLYGPSAMAMTGGDGSGLFMEICADGAVKTVEVDASGTPVDRDDTCHDCLTCCQSPTTDTPVAPAACHPVTVWTVSAHPISDSGCVFQTSNTRPLPRGPPALIEFQSNMLDAIDADRPEGHSGMCRIGRPYCKDAVA